jgi:hypothetical protein
MEVFLLPRKKSGNIIEEVENICQLTTNLYTAKNRRVAPYCLPG